jgi:Cof subfamily protein (haloacid dehalogenase superfamily)
MGKFDGILLCSDWDGTLCEGDVISKNNIEAIRYFQKNGGKFTLASGRYAGHFKRFENEISPNTDLICVGGSCIMSANGEILYERFCNERFEEYAKILMKEGSPYEQMQVTLRGHGPFSFDKTSILTEDAKKILTQKTIYKAIFLTQITKEAELAAIEYLKPLAFEGYMPMRSFPYSVELIPAEGGKGNAVRWLAKKIGARLIVAVGDYENDCDMLKMADYGYAVTGGSSLARKSANRFAASVKVGAVASVIEELDREF